MVQWMAESKIRQSTDKQQRQHTPLAREVSLLHHSTQLTSQHMHCIGMSGFSIANCSNYSGGVTKSLPCF